MIQQPNRRAFLGTVAAGAVSAPMLANAHTEVPGSEDFVYQVTRTEAEWRERLSEAEYYIMREFGTEQRFASDLVEEERDGHYHCRGCDLTIYDSDQKTIRQIGWVFFYHARPDSVLLGIDELPLEMTGADGVEQSIQLTEAHCRRCGSHLGHVLLVQGDMLHCINGTALDFAANEES